VVGDCFQLGRDDVLVDMDSLVGTELHLQPVTSRSRCRWAGPPDNLSSERSRMEVHTSQSVTVTPDKG